MSLTAHRLEPIHSRVNARRHLKRRKIMAEYEYQCLICNEVTSVHRSMVDDEVIPFHCSSLMSRRFYAAPVKFNAGGFYSVDK